MSTKEMAEYIIAFHCVDCLSDDFKCCIWKDTFDLLGLKKAVKILMIHLNKIHLCAKN